MKNTMKRIITIVLALAILFTAANPTPAEAAAKKAKLNKTSVTLKITKKKTSPSAALKVKNTTKTVKWTTSNKKVATVQKTGKYKAKIVAKKAGKATITCNVNGKKLTCKVTVVDKRTSTTATKTPTTPEIPTPAETTCEHTWEEHWAVFEDEGDHPHDQPLYICSCGTFTSKTEYNEHLWKLMSQSGICTKNERKCGVHGTQAKSTVSSFSNSDGETIHWAIRTEYIDYLYCTKCNARITNPLG